MRAYCCSIVSPSALDLTRSLFALCRTLWSIASLFGTSQVCPRGLTGRPTPIELTWGAPSLKDHGLGGLPELDILNGREVLGWEILGTHRVGGPGTRWSWHKAFWGAWRKKCGWGDDRLLARQPPSHGARSADGEKRCLRRRGESSSACADSRA